MFWGNEGTTLPPTKQNRKEMLKMSRFWGNEGERTLHPPKSRWRLVEVGKWKLHSKTLHY